MNQCNRCGRQFSDSGVSGVESSEASRPCPSCLSADRIESLRSQLLIARDAELEALAVLREAEWAAEIADETHRTARRTRIGIQVELGQAAFGEAVKRD